MKSTKKQFPVKRLFIFGAGASYSSSFSPNKNYAPLDKEFCNRISLLNYNRPQWVKESCELINVLWQDQSDFTKLGLERALTLQLGNIDFLNAIQPHRRLVAGTRSEYLKHLSHLIVFVLEKATENKHKPYEQFVTKVFNQPFENCYDRLISFNYDGLLDQYLLAKYLLEQYILII